MGYTVLLQWSLSAQNRTAPLNEYILTRTLEHYGLSQPIRTTVQFRTYKASFAPSGPSDANPAPVQRLLTTVIYSQPLPAVRDAVIPNTPRDDTMYLFLDDRGSSSSAPDSRSEVGGTVSAQADATAPQQSEGETKATLEEDGFEIVDGSTETKPSDPSIAPADPGIVDNPPDGGPAGAKVPRCQTLAVCPSASVLPLLHHLLSPFVLGLTKSARSAASTTAEVPRPTSLPGVPLMLTSLTFPPPPAPHPQVILTLHNHPTLAATSIFLEAEIHDTETGDQDCDRILREFLDGCLPEGGIGEKKYISWDEEGSNPAGEGWEGIERTRRATHLLAKALRDSGFL